MLQLMVTGKVEGTEKINGNDGELLFVNVDLVEKYWTGTKEEQRHWTITLDKYWGERLIKAMAQIKYFGFLCDSMRVEGEYHSKKQTVILLHYARGNKFFTL